MKGIYELSQSFSETLSLEETYRIIDKQARELLNADYSTILLYQNGQLKRVFTSCPLLSKAVILKNGRTYKAYQTGVPFAARIKSKKDIHPASLYNLNLRSIIFIPLLFQKQTIGVFNVLSRNSYEFSEHDVLSLKIFGSLISLSIRNAQLNEENCKALELRDLFFAAAAHELKTPVTTIKLYGQMLKKTLEKGKLPDDKLATVVLREIERITHLTNQFLLVNRIKTGHMFYELAQNSISKIIRHAVIEFKANHKQTLIFRNLLGSKSDRVFLDEDKFTEAIGNILTNAAKYSSDSAKIYLTLSFKAPHFIITVKDYGHGISKKDLKKIFDVFVKGTSTVKEGIGMGLYLTKAIIEGHRGRIQLQSKLYKGTTVKILLPEKVS